MKNVVSLSGGKDSTCMLLMMLENNMQVDEIVFCDTGLEFDDMYKHMELLDNYIKEKYNKTIITIKNDKNFEYYLYEHILTKGKRIGSKGYGFPSQHVRWCTDRLKMRPLNKYFKNVDKIEYIGIAYDEKKRIKDNEKIKYPLYDWGITEKQALQYCYDKGFTWNGLYEKFNRVSCWCCPLQQIGELETLYKYFPDKFNLIKKWETLSGSQFRIDYSIFELEQRFIQNDKQLKFDM